MARIKRTWPPGSQLDLACFSASSQLMILSMKLNGKIQTIKIRASIGRASLISQSIDSSPRDASRIADSSAKRARITSTTWRVAPSTSLSGLQRHSNDPQVERLTTTFVGFYAYYDDQRHLHFRSAFY